MSQGLNEIKSWLLRHVQEFYGSSKLLRGTEKKKLRLDVTFLNDRTFEMTKKEKKIFKEEKQIVNGQKVRLVSTLKKMFKYA